MENPQIENGHTEIANEILEALWKVNLSSYETRVLIYLIRKTYGWHKKVDWIALSQFSKEIGIDRRLVHRTLKALSSKGMIVVIPKDDKQRISYGFQKNYDKWNLSSLKMTHKKTVIPQDDELSSPEIPTKETITKEKKYSDDFIMFWLRYPKKVGKKAAYKAWLNAKDKPDIKIIFAALADQKRSDQWLKNAGQFIPNPATWINQGRWDDEITTSPNPQPITKTFPNCPKCGKETTNEDIKKFDSCPACYKPLPPDKLKQLLSGIGKDVK